MKTEQAWLEYGEGTFNMGDELWVMINDLSTRWKTAYEEQKQIFHGEQSATWVTIQDDISVEKEHIESLTERVL